MHVSRTIRGYKKNLVLKRKLRSKLTPAENKLWLQLRSKQFLGLKFRRQHGVGSYIVDFFCSEKKLVIEVDGDVHALERQIEKDRFREEYLKNLGINIVRYANNDILKNIEGVLEDLMNTVNSLSTSPDPSLQRRGG